MTEHPRDSQELECVGGPCDGERKFGRDVMGTYWPDQLGTYQVRRYSYPDGREEDVWEWIPEPDWAR